MEALCGVPDEHAAVQGLGCEAAARQEAHAVDGLPVLRPALRRQLLRARAQPWSYPALPPIGPPCCFGQW